MVRRRVSAQYRNIGLLILRVGLGVMFVLHGYPKLFGGPEMWEKVGSEMQAIGIYFLPSAFGFFAAVTEFFGGLFLLMGLFFRPAVSFLLIVMIVASLTHIANGDPFSVVSHSIEVGIIFISLLFMGPGNYSLQDRLGKRRRRW